jgi:hypothetical protein
MKACAPAAMDEHKRRHGARRYSGLTLPFKLPAG